MLKPKLQLRLTKNTILPENTGPDKKTTNRQLTVSVTPFLLQVGEMLARYDVEKQCAVEKRDYELAEEKTELMEDYRRRVYQQLEVYNLLDMAMVSR